jgi:outer membrane receptor protein involved in Fe transport
LQLDGSFHDEFWVNPQVPTQTTPFEATTRIHAHVPTVTFGHLTHTLSPNTFWEVRAGRFVYSRKDDPSSGNFTTPNRSDQVTKINSGAPQQIGGMPGTLIRTTVKATLNHYQRSFLGANHEWRVGTQIEQGYHRSTVIIPTGTRYVDNNGQPFQSVSADPSVNGGEFNSGALFATDTMTFGERLTVNAGLRFDHNHAISQDLHTVDAMGRDTGTIVRGRGSLFTWNLVSPRLGVAVKLSRDGRTVLRSSYGRFYQGVLTAELSSVHPGNSPVTTRAYDPATGGYTTLVSVVDAKTQVSVDPNTRSPHTDEYSIGVDRELGRRLSVAAAYIGKTGRDYIGWTDVGGQYRADTRTLPDGRSVPVFVLTNSPADRRFLVTNPSGYSLKYNGLVLAAEKRVSNRWQALGSYTFSRATGLQATSGTTAGGGQFSTIALNSNIFGRDPNDLTNARGLLPNDRPHMFRVMGTMEMPRTGLTIATNFQYYTGKPWAATTQVTLPQGSQRIQLEPRGTRRLSPQSLLDLRVSRTIVSRGLGHVELVLDVLNVLNIRTAEELASDNLFASNFGRPNVFTDPRRAMVGIRFKLGGE